MKKKIEEQGRTSTRYPKLKALSEQGFIMLARLCKERTLISGVFWPIFRFSGYFGQFLGFGDISVIF